MRVLQVNKAYAPTLGGIETVVRQLAEGLAERLGYETEVLVCNTRRQTEKRQVGPISVTYTGSLGRCLSLPVSPSYVAELGKRSADIVHIHEPFPLGDLAYLLLGQRRRNFKRLFVWWHSDIVRQRYLHCFYAPVVRRLLQLADTIVVATPHHITTSRFLPEVREKCRVVHYGVDPARYEPNGRAAAVAEGLPGPLGSPLLLFVGRLVYYKGVEYLLRAMAHVPHAYLAIVGKGPLKARLVALAERTCPSRVTFLPPQEQKSLAALFHACDIFVLPSTEPSEQFGLVQLEAMACAKPVITTNLPTGVTYVNRHGITGLTVPPRDPRALAEAIAALLEDVSLRHRLGSNGRDRVLAEFTVERMLEQVAALYEASVG